MHCISVWIYRKQKDPVIFGWIFLYMEKSIFQLVIWMQVFNFWDLKAFAIQPLNDFINQSLVGTGWQRKQDLLVV